MCYQQQWDLVCDKKVWTETTQTVLVIGVLIGAIIMTGVADKFGRKWTFLMNACAGTLVVFLTALVDNYYLFTALRFLLGIFLQARFSTSMYTQCINNHCLYGSMHIKYINNIPLESQQICPRIYCKFVI